MEAEVPTEEEQLRALLEETVGARLLPKFEKHLGSLLAKGYSDRELLNNATREGLRETSLPPALIDTLLKDLGQGESLLGGICFLLCPLLLACLR